MSHWKKKKKLIDLCSNFLKQSKLILLVVLVNFFPFRSLPACYAQNNVEACPGSFVGTWIDTGGKDEGKLDINVNSIKWQSPSWGDSFEIKCKDLTIKEDGSLLINPKNSEMLHISAVLFNKAFPVHPTITIKPAGSDSLLLEVSSFEVESGGAFEKTVVQDHTLNKLANNV